MPRHGENIYKRKDGRYEGRYVIGKTLKGKTRFGYVYARQYAEVRKQLLQKKAEMLMDMNFSFPQHQSTLAEWMDYWMESELLGSIKASSWQTYRNQLTHHVLPVLGKCMLSEITSQRIHDFVANLETSGLAKSTIRGVYRLLASAMRFALEEGVIRKNPCRKIRIQHAESAEQRVFSRTEQEKMRQAADRSRDLPALLSLYTGMRLGEVCALKWSDIDWERRTITVRRTVQRIARINGAKTSGKTILMVGTPKSVHSHRVLPVPELILDKLQKMQRDATDSEYVFSVTTQAVDPRTIQRRFKRLMDRLGITGAHFHTLRHPYVKHTTKKFNSEKQKTQATKIVDLITWVFCFCIVSYSKRSWTL